MVGKHLIETPANGQAQSMQRVIEIKTVTDIVTARQSGRDMSRLLGFGLVDQTKLATAISELTRNVIQYAGSGTCVITHVAAPDALVVRVEVEDRGPGIVDIEAAMVHGASTGGGWGAGLPGSKRLVERFEIDSRPGRTKVTLELIRPRHQADVLAVRPAPGGDRQVIPAADTKVQPERIAASEPGTGSASKPARVIARALSLPFDGRDARPAASAAPTQPAQMLASSSSAGLLSTVRVENDFGILQARQAARTIADTVGFSRVATCCIVTAVSELATNLVSHTVKGGLMTFTAVRVGDDRLGIEVSCVDEGPGMTDVASAVEGGESTTGSLGAGLRAVTRMMDEVEIQSRAGRGSAIVARKWRADE